MEQSSGTDSGSKNRVSEPKNSAAPKPEFGNKSMRASEHEAKAEEKEVKELVTIGERFKASEVENKIAAASLHEDKLLKAFTHCSKASEAEFIAAEQYSSGTSEQELNTLEQQYKEIEAVENAR